MSSCPYTVRLFFIKYLVFCSFAGLVMVMRCPANLSVSTVFIEIRYKILSQVKINNGKNQKQGKQQQRKQN